MSPADPRTVTEGPGPHLTRRSLLGVSLLTAGAAACSDLTTAGAPEGDISDPHRTPLPPEDIGQREYIYFSTEEVLTIEAIMGRLMPGDPADPGAVEMGASIYLDRKLAEFEGHAEPTYMTVPHAVGVPPGQSPALGSDRIAVPSNELYRYGYQSATTPRELYRLGLAATDRYAQSRFGEVFADLPAERQDQILAEFEAVGDRSQERHPGYEEVEGAHGFAGEDDEEDFEAEDAVLDEVEEIFGDLDAGEFFSAAYAHTIEGVFADPAYGGNVNLAGWVLIGYPGAQRAYSPADLRYGTDRTPQSMDGLTPMNPDRLEEHGVPAIEQGHQHENVHEGH